MRRLGLAFALACALGLVGEAAGLTVALRFGAATSNRVTVANSTTTQDVMPMSFLVAYRPSTITANNSLYMKGSAAGSSRKFIRIDSGGQLTVLVDRAGLDTTFTTNSTPLVAGQVTYIMVTIDQSVSTNVHIYAGTAASPMTEATYSSTVDGSGGTSSDAATSAQLCNVFATDNACKGDVWSMQLVGGVLSIDDGKRWQRRAAQNPLMPGVRGAWTMGQNGAGRVLDKSGNNNHGTITGAIPVSETLPLLGWRRAA